MEAFSATAELGAARGRRIVIAIVSVELMLEALGSLAGWWIAAAFAGGGFTYLILEGVIERSFFSQNLTSAPRSGSATAAASITTVPAAHSCSSIPNDHRAPLVVCSERQRDDALWAHPTRRLTRWLSRLERLFA